MPYKAKSTHFQALEEKNYLSRISLWNVETVGSSCLRPSAKNWMDILVFYILFLVFGE